MPSPFPIKSNNIFALLIYRQYSWKPEQLHGQANKLDKIFINFDFNIQVPTITTTLSGKENINGLPGRTNVRNIFDDLRRMQNARKGLETTTELEATNGLEATSGVEATNGTPSHSSDEDPTPPMQIDIGGKYYCGQWEISQIDEYLCSGYEE